jgi:hypothetical protein
MIESISTNNTIIVLITLSDTLWDVKRFQRKRHIVKPMISGGGPVRVSAMGEEVKTMTSVAIIMR